MIIALILAIIGCSSLAYWSGKLLWKHFDNKIIGTIPLLMLFVVAGISFFIHKQFKPSDLTSNQYILLIYIFSFLFFVLELNVTYRIIYKNR